MYELSKITGIPSNTVYGWVRMDAVPTLSNVEKICEAMQITLEQFFCGVGEKNTAEESKLLEEWFLLSELEKEAIFAIIDVFKTLRK